MTKYPWSVVMRLAAFLMPLLALYLYASYAAAQASGQAHRGDTGLGIAILMGAMTLLMLFGFFVDFICQVIRKRTFNWLIDLLIIGCLLTPFGWFACNWFGGQELLICKPPMWLFGVVLEWLGM